ncbi:hypothetical protein B2_16 [Stenotrophomonas phage B2]|nr:hypothetical protein B2_16 [Stenotrophomonas phage B2]
MYTVKNKSFVIHNVSRSVALDLAAQVIADGGSVCIQPTAKAIAELEAQAEQEAQE